MIRVVGQTVRARLLNACHGTPIFAPVSMHCCDSVTAYGGELHRGARVHVRTRARTWHMRLMGVGVGVGVGVLGSVLACTVRSLFVTEQPYALLMRHSETARASYCVTYVPEECAHESSAEMSRRAQR